MGSAHLRLKRDYLYSEDSHCRRCGVETVLPSIDNNGALDSNAATIQHIKPKFHPDYHKDITLWCYKCNNLDAQNKSKNHIYSRDEMVYFLSKTLKPLRGLYIVDGIAITYKDHKPIKIQEIYEAKLDLLSKYMVYYIDSYSGKINKNKTLHQKYSVEKFEKFFNKKIKGIFNIEQYSIGDGWYQTPHYRENMIDVFAQTQNT